MSTYKYAPDVIGIHVPGEGFYPAVPVKRFTLSPPCEGAAHPGTAIKAQCALLTMHTEIGDRHYGVTRGRIDGSLRMAVELWPGCERDAVVARWDNAPGWV